MVNAIVTEKEKARRKAVLLSGLAAMMIPVSSVLFEPVRSRKLKHSENLIAFQLSQSGVLAEIAPKLQEMLYSLD